jgi:hypothetical protein
LRKLTATIVFGLLLIFSAGTGPAQAQPGVFTFKFTNKAPFTVFVRMFSESRNVHWPAQGHFILNDGVKRDARISCLVGERVCYGASYQTDGGGRYWGVGYNGNQTCADCCVRCGTMQENLSASWNLVE